MIRDEPRPPAIAYGPMAQILGEGYFLSQPPESGVRLTVVGFDRIATQWDVAHSVANSVIRKARRKGLAVTSSTPYTEVRK